MSEQQLPQTSSSREDWQALAIQVLKSCGYGPLLAVGVNDPGLIRELLCHGVEVSGLTASPEVVASMEAMAPGRVKLAAASAPLRLDQDVRFDTVILFAGPWLPDAWFDDEELPRQLVRSGKSLLVLLQGERDSRENRAIWVQRLRLAGARLHPLSHEMVPYCSNESMGRALLLYEQGPEASTKLSAGKRLKSIAFESDGGAKARAARYAMAARFVRSGDRVLDSVSLNGDGAYLLSRSTAASIVGWNANSQAVASARRLFTSATSAALMFERVPTSGMESLASESFDFIVSDGCTDKFDLSWNEARRVLTPGGRIYVSCRVDEDDVGTIANALRDELESSGLLLERSWLQHPHTMRGAAIIGVQVEELRLADMSPVEGDRILLLAMKSVSDCESSMMLTESDEGGPNVTAFARDYENPWIIRGLVAIGLRATSVNLRVAMADEILAVAPTASADRGAALCVRCYAELEQASDAEVLRHWQALALEFANTHASNPSALRWQISLLYVAGLMAQKTGDLLLAKSTFTRMANHDALAFSPLLGTKTVGAAFRSGVIAFASGDHDGAREEWRRALAETRRLLREGDWREIVVDPDRPETFGLPEVAAFVMEGARAAGGLRALQEFPDKPSLVWQALHCTQADLLTAQDLELRSLRQWWGDHDRQRDAWIDELDQAKAWLENQNSSWRSTAGAKDEQLKALTAQMAQLDEGRTWLEQQLASWQSTAGAKDEQLKALTAQMAQLDEGRAWLEEQLASWQSTAGAKDEQLEALTAQVTQLDESRNWLEQQLASWQSTAGAKDEQLKALTAQMAQLDEGRTWLEQQLASWQSTASAKDEQLEALTAQVTELDESRRWLEEQLASWQSAAGAKDEQLKALTAQMAQLDEGRTWLEQQLASWQSTASAKDEQLEALTAQVTQLDESRNWLEQQLASWQALADTRDRQLKESAGQISRLRDTIALAESENDQLSIRQQQAEQRILAMQGEIHAIVKNSIEENHRLRAIELSRWVRFGRKLGLIQIRE